MRWERSRYLKYRLTLYSSRRFMTTAQTKVARTAAMSTYQTKAVPYFAHL